MHLLLNPPGSLLSLAEINERYSFYSKHPLIRTPTGPKNLFRIANVRIIGGILKGNYRKGIKNPFELARVRIIGRRINGC